MLPVTSKLQGYTEVTLLRLVREIAMDIFPIETILEHHQIPLETFHKIKDNPRFIELLESEVLAWNSAGNTHERTKLKAAALIEEWLEEANTRLHDKDEALNSKVELGKLLARIAEMGTNKADVAGGAGEHFKITINLGADAQLNFSKQAAPKVIDHQPLETQ